MRGSPRQGLFSSKTCFTVLFFLSAAPVDCRTDDRRGGRQLSQTVEPTTIAWSLGTLLEPNSTEEQGGGIVFPDLLPTGDVLVGAADNLQPTVKECIEACRDFEGCNVVYFCPLEAGCVNEYYDIAFMPFGGCQLLNQALSSPDTGRPLVAVNATGFIGGAPIMFTVPPLRGYDIVYGISFWYSYDYPCPAGVATVTQPSSCGLTGAPSDFAQICDGDPRCRAMVFWPFGRDYLGDPRTIFKGGPGVQLNISASIYNQNSVVYLKQAPFDETIIVDPSGGGGSDSGSDSGSGGGSGGGSDNGSGSGSSGGGLSAGAVAGIVVGACCGVVLAGAAVLLAWRRRRKQQLDKAASRVPAGDQGLEARESFAGSRASGSYADSAAWIDGLPASLQLSGDLPRHPSSSAPTPPATLVSSGGASVWMADGRKPHSNGTKATADAVARPQAGAGAGAPLARPSLSPEGSGWRTTVEFCRGGDGSYAELGSGAFSTVYRVLLDGCQPHAAKLLRLGGDTRAREAFLKEAELLRQIRHKNIVGFTGAYVSEDGSGVIIMELMEGGDLSSRLQRLTKAGGRAFGWHSRGKMVCLDVACALHYLHSNNFLHLDVKPKNVLLSRDGTAKLCDVGLSQKLRATHHSVASATPGTWDYMAPELLLGRTCTSAADIYSFGVLLWEVCTGEYPVRGCLRALDVPRECPQEVADLFSRCVDEDPATRPSARELVQRLSKMQRPGGPPGESRAPAASTTASRVGGGNGGGSYLGLAREGASRTSEGAITVAGQVLSDDETVMMSPFRLASRSE